MSKLIDSAKEIVSNLNYHRLAENGFPKDFSRYCFTATYPPLKAMAPVTPKQIFKHTSPSSGSYDLYLHYPFCSGKCTFCHFPTYSYNPKFSESYISALIKEISLVSLSLNHPKISTIYFGGGSPSLITLENLSKIITEVKKEFNLQDLKQFTLEIHPELFNTKDSEQFFRNIKKLGINRVSIGIQDFNLKVLEAVNRRHDTKEAVEIIKLASKYFTVNIDLLCPLPHQTLSTWEQTIKKAFALKPDSITLYTTAIREHMAIYRDYSSNKTLPSLDDYFTMYSMTQLLAADLSYTENPVGWFKKPDAKSNPNSLLSHLPKFFKKPKPSSTEENLGLIGIGAATYSYINNYQYYSEPRIDSYIKAISENRLPTWMGIKLSPSEQLRRELIFSLKNKSIDLKALKTKYHQDHLKEFNAPIKRLVELGLVSLSQDTLTLTPLGVLFSDEIALNLVSPSILKKISQYKLSSTREVLVEYHNFFHEI